MPDREKKTQAVGCGVVRAIFALAVKWRGEMKTPVGEKTSAQSVIKK